MAYQMQPQTITAATTLSRDRHANTWVGIDNATGFITTLPTSTGDGDVYKLWVVTTVSSGNHVIQVGNATDEFRGGVSISTDAAGVTFLISDNDDTLTMNGSTQGGLLGSWVTFTDVASGIWLVSGFLCSSGAEADPFSAAV